MNVAEIQSLLNPNRGTTTQANDQLAQEDFLELMIAQLRNQDPTKPQDADALFGQLTGFATVDGIERMDNSMQAMLRNLGAGQALGAASLIDRAVLVPSDVGYLDEGGTIEGTIAVPLPADSLTVRIVGPSGATVREMNLGRQAGGEVEFSWDGLDEDGEALPPGEYGIEVEASIAGLTTSLQALIASRVESVALGGPNGETMLTVAGLGQIPLSAVQEIGALQTPDPTEQSEQREQN